MIKLNYSCNSSGVLSFEDIPNEIWVYGYTFLRDLLDNERFDITLEASHLPHSLSKAQTYDLLPQNQSKYKATTKILLTKKESECLHYLLQGKSAKVIAAAMRISHRTVECHLDRIKEKFSCRNKSELIAKAIQLGYLNDKAV